MSQRFDCWANSCRVTLHKSELQEYQCRKRWPPVFRTYWQWFPDFANFRRDGYDFDARYDDGLAPHKDKFVYDTVQEKKTLLSKELKDMCNYRKGGNKGFETIITRLQMQIYINISDFEYRVDKNGNRYGWGVARYSTPEAQFGTNLLREVYKREPGESKARMLTHLQRLLPQAGMQQLEKVMKGR